MKQTSPQSLDISIVVPCRNERRYIQAFLESVVRQDFNGISWEVLIADGMSNDGTRVVIEDYSCEYPIRLINNDEQIVSTGLNKAIREAQGRYIVRMDVHTTYASDYLRQCLRVAEETGADNVGGPWVPQSEDYIGRAIAAVFQSPFGTGGAKAHDPNYEGIVDTVYLGCWPRDVFRRIGYFDVELVRNQDDEFNLRLRRSGGLVWQSPSIVSFYHPRSSLRALFRQYMQYGYWKVAVIRKHRMPASYRHLVPGGFVLANCILAAMVSSLWGVGLNSLSAFCALWWVILDCVYLGFCVAASLLTARKHGWVLLPVLPVVFAAYHISYGYGFLRGIFRSHRITKRDASHPVFTELTR
jgi:glycosyltransferase involved in cell wall biosynthesis